MPYTIKLYNSSGFSKENIPDSPSLLDDLEVVEVPSLNILQDRFLSEVTLKVEYETIKNCDYCKIGDSYYFIDNILSTSRDVCKIFIKMDCLTSAGGVVNLDFIDGITERHHIGEIDEEFGKYTEDDPLLSCIEPLQITGYSTFIPDEKGNTYIESTVDLVAMGDETNAITYTDNQTGKQIAVPSTKTPTHSTKYGIRKSSDVTANDILFPEIIGKCSFIAATWNLIDGTLQENELVKSGVKRCRDLGIESSILAQYTVPAVFSGGISGSTLEPDITELYGKFGDTEFTPTDGFNFEYAEVKNKRVLYGLSNQYEILCPNGNSGLYKPEDLYYKNFEEEQPHIWLFADVRAEGSPYYRFKYLNKKGVEDGKNCDSILNGCIKGSQWTSVPLTFSQKSGNSLDLYNFTSELASFGYSRFSQNVQSDIGLFTSGLNFITSPLSLGNYQGAPKSSGMGPMPADKSSSKAYSSSMNSLNSFSSITSGISGVVGGFANSYVDSTLLPLQQENTLQKMYTNFGYSQNVVVPQVMFPFQSETLRDILKNGFVTFRYRPSDTDLARQDKLLTMYGYRHTAIFEKSFLTNRINFNYLKCYNLSIKSAIPQWLKEGCLSQLEGGVRIWHTKPDEQYYDNNPVKTNT